MRSPWERQPSWPFLRRRWAPSATAKQRIAKFNATVRGLRQTRAPRTAPTATALLPEPGTSHETIVFATTAPFKVKLLFAGPVTFINNGGLAKFSVAGTVNRTTAGEFAPPCVTEPQDCGTKPFSGLKMMLQGAGAQWHGFSVDSGGVGSDVFGNCINGGPHGFPGIVRTELAVSKPALLNRRKKTITETGTNTVTGAGSYGAHGTATITTTLTLTRR